MYRHSICFPSWFFSCSVTPTFFEDFILVLEKYISVAISGTVNAQEAGMPEGGSGMEGSGCEGSGGEGSGCEASGEASGAPGGAVPPPM
ncbi:hypothetical protein Q1695_015783 [Nippostrongylus brasiliensis]|nr:hypothetical protein Q1695_015783 [Nippostrongylus brasiliensis]